MLNVANDGSFAAVARARGVDPSSISRAVAAVEAKIGLRLFQRSTRVLQITPEGRTYLDTVAPLLDALDAAAETARGSVAQPKGTLRIAASVAFGTRCLIPLLSRFRSAYPDLAIDLVLEDRHHDLIPEGIDIAIRHAPEPRGDLVCRKLRTVAYLVCATPEVAAEFSTPSALQHSPVLRQSLPDFRDAWQVRAPTGATETFAITGEIVMSAPLALLAAARAGLGPALLADWLSAEDIAAGHLVRLWPNHTVAATSFDAAIWLVYPSRVHLPARTRAGLDILIEALGN